MMYKTIQEIKSPMKLGKGIYVKDVIFIAVYFMLTKRLETLCYSGLIIPLYIVNVIWGIYFILPSMKNPQRRNWQVLLFSTISMVTDNRFFMDVSGKALPDCVIREEEQHG